MRERPRRPSRRLVQCFQCLMKTWDDGKRPLHCYHCGAVIFESVWLPPY